MVAPAAEASARPVLREGPQSVQVWAITEVPLPEVRARFDAVAVVVVRWCRVPRLPQSYLTPAMAARVLSVLSQECHSFTREAGQGRTFPTQSLRRLVVLAAEGTRKLMVKTDWVAAVAVAHRQVIMPDVAALAL